NRYSPPKSLQAGERVEAAIERQEGFDAISLHDGDVQCIACGELGRAEQDVLRSISVLVGDRENVVHDVEQRVERSLDSITAIDCTVAMKNLLKDLCVGYQALVCYDAALEKTLGVGLMWMGRPDEIHWDVGIHEDQSTSEPYPRSISSRISSMSAVGARWVAAARIAASFFSFVATGCS